jgi:ribonucleoside-diphosphate reductase alpha chain
VAKQGSTLSGVMDAFAIAVSIALQYGVPLETYVSKFINMRFEPSGVTNDSDIRFASSLVDYVFRRLALDYLPVDQRHELGIRSIAERKAETGNGNGHAEAPAAADTADAAPDATTARPGEITEMRLAPKPESGSRTVDAPFCYSCGSKMQAAGSCYVCNACGSTSGCS